MKDGRRNERGVVLPLVLIIGLLLSAAVFTFVRRSTMDAMIIQNRETSAALESLARGGAQIGMAIVLQDRLAKDLAQGSAKGSPGTTLDDLWARVGGSQLETDWGATLRLDIIDAGARLNLNSLVPIGREGAEAKPDESAENFVAEFLERVITEQELENSEKTYDYRELAQNLLDYIDSDDTRLGAGGDENDWYLSQNPPIRPANGPMTSVEELGMVQGFDQNLVDALRPYLTVYPLLGATGINMNTAPPHVLGLIYYGPNERRRLADETQVGDIMRARENGQVVCTRDEVPDRSICVSLGEVGLSEGSIFPEEPMPMHSRVFTVRSEASMDEVRRVVEVNIDVSDRAEPFLLSWRIE